VKGSFVDFYDELSMLKSPSFGTEFTLCCPYVYLAHYDMIKSKEGRMNLQQAKLPPELLRLSVGLEDPVEIKEVLGRALNKC
jgi:cystathionine gamma-synthase